MKLSDAFTELAYGELHGNALAMNGYIQEKDAEKVKHFLTMGLTALYTRFPLLLKELTVVQKSWLTQYPLKKVHAVTDPGEEVKFILDSRLDPFLGDVLRIEEVVDEVGDVLELNSTDYDKVALTPAMDVLEIPNPCEGNALFVTYRANHPPLVDMDSEIQIPMQYLGALYAYVGARAYAGSVAQEHVGKSSELTSKFEGICRQMELLGMTNSDTLSINMKPRMGGWV